MKPISRIFAEVKTTWQHSALRTKWKKMWLVTEEVTYDWRQNILKIFNVPHQYFLMLFSSIVIGQKSVRKADLIQ